MAVDPLGTPRLPPSLVAQLYDRSRGADWGLPRDAFRAAVEASVRHAFAGVQPMTSEVHEYLASLQVEDLALAAACAGGSEPAWEHFVREFRPLLRRAADAIDPAGGARELADSLFADLYGLREREGGRSSLLRYFHGRSRLATWLRAVLAQRLIDRVRAGRTLQPLPDDPETLPASRTASPRETGRDRYLHAMRHALAAAVAGLAPRDRLRLGSYYAQGLTLAAIGRLLKEHEATVSRNLARTRTELRAAVETRLESEHGMDAATRADCVRSVTEDAGTLDLAEILDPGPRRKNAGPDRSRE